MKKDVTFIILGVVITIVGLLTPILFYGVSVTKDIGFVAWIGALLLIDLVCYVVYKLNNDKGSERLKENLDMFVLFSRPMLYLAHHAAYEDNLQEHNREEQAQNKNN